MNLTVQAIEAETIGRFKNLIASAGFCLSTEDRHELKRLFLEKGYSLASATKAATRAIQNRKLYQKAAEREPQLKSVRDRIREFPTLEQLAQHFQRLAAMDGLLIQTGTDLRTWLAAIAERRPGEQLTAVFARLTLARSRDREGKLSPDQIQALKLRAYEAPTRRDAVDLLIAALLGD